MNYYGDHHQIHGHEASARLADNGRKKQPFLGFQLEFPGRRRTQGKRTSGGCLRTREPASLGGNEGQGIEKGQKFQHSVDTTRGGSKVRGGGGFGERTEVTSSLVRDVNEKCLKNVSKPSPNWGESTYRWGEEGVGGRGGTQKGRKERGEIIFLGHWIPLWGGRIHAGDKR